jgi:hypothetical protein
MSLDAHLDASNGARAVTARSTSLGRGGREHSRAVAPPYGCGPGLRGPLTVSQCALSLAREKKRGLQPGKSMLDWPNKI